MTSFLQVLLVVSLAVSACGDSNYQRAAVGTGVAVAAVAVHRAITGYCWGQCRSGLVCNEKKGVCEPGECAPACSAGSHCTRTVHGDLLCTPDTGTYTLTRRAPPVARAGAGGSLDGGTGTALDGGAAVPATDAR